MVKRAKIASIPKKVKILKEDKGVEVEVVTTERTRTGKPKANEPKEAISKRTRLVTKERGAKAKKIANENEDIVVLTKKKPIVVDLDPADLRQYVDNKVESIRNEPKVTDINRDISEYIANKIKEKLD